MRKGEVAIVLCTSATDKTKVFSTFIHEGIVNGEIRCMQNRKT